MDFIYKHRNKLFIIASILLLIPFLFNIGLGEDEPFTMGIIQHSYSEIVNLTTLDVHPPLYYFVLKFFLSITTFWTSNIFIKIIFARLLSVIFSLIAFVYLNKSSKLLHIRCNTYLQWLLFLLLPLELGLSPQTTNLRMYALSIMIFSLVMYNILRFEDTTKTKYFLGIYISTTASLYNNYYGGLIVGIFLGCYVIYNLLVKSWKKAFLIIVSGLLSIISFIPWMPSVLSQSRTLPNHALDSSISHYAIEIILIIFIFGFSSIFSAINTVDPKDKNQKLNIILILVSSILISFILSLKLGHIMYASKYLCSIIVPFEFIGVISFMNNYKSYKTVVKTIISISIFIFIGAGLLISGYRQIKNFTLPTVTFVNKFNDIKESNQKNINIKNNGLNKYVWDNQGGNAIYLLSINKSISDKNYLTTNEMLGSGNPKLFHSIFPNVKHYVIQGRQQ